MNGSERSKETDVPPPVVTYHLEMTKPDDLQPSTIVHKNAEIREATVPCPELNRMFYETVGKAWDWTSRLTWSETRWQEYVGRPELRTWIGFFSDTPMGYFELETQANANVEIRIFGLLPSFLGKRLGGWFLTNAIQSAWTLGANRVWVHTCTLDHPKALENYRARGFKQFKQETHTAEEAALGLA